METIFDESVMSRDTVTSEKALVVPALLILAQAERMEHGPISTFQLHEILSSMVEMSEDDRKTSGQDHFTRFRRTVQNMFSHNLLQNGEEKWVEKTKEGFVITSEGRAALLDILFSDVREVPTEARINFGSQTRIVESMVAYQMLLRLAELQRDNKIPVSTARLRSDIKNSMPLSASDIKPLKNRPDHKIDQVIRNVISHNTLTKKGFVERSEKGLVITPEGEKFVLGMILRNFSAPNFSFLVSREKEFRQNLNERRAEVLRVHHKEGKKTSKPSKGALKATEDCENSIDGVAKNEKRIKLG